MVLTCITVAQNESIWQGKIDPICVENDWKLSNEPQLEQFDPKLQVIQLMLYEHRKTDCTTIGLSVNFFVEDNDETSASINIVYKYADKLMTDSFLEYKLGQTRCPSCYDFSLPEDETTDIITLNVANGNHTAFYDGIEGKLDCFHEKVQLDRLMNSGSVKHALFQHNFDCQNQDQQHISFAYRILPFNSKALQCHNPPDIKHLARGLSFPLPLNIGTPQKIICEPGYMPVGDKIVYCKGSGDQYSFLKDEPECVPQSDSQVQCPTTLSNDSKCTVNQQVDIGKRDAANVSSKHEENKQKISREWAIVIFLAIANVLIGLILVCLMHAKCEQHKNLVQRTMSERVRLLDNQEDEESSDQEHVIFNKNSAHKFRNVDQNIKAKSASGKSKMSAPPPPPPPPLPPPPPPPPPPRL